MLPILAEISGRSVMSAVVGIIIVALCFWLLSWLIDYIQIGEPFNKVLKVVLAVAAVILLINFLLGLGGHNFIAW